MDFFEAVKEGAKRNYQREHPFQPYTEGAASAINATIEALKQMMVGEPRVWFITTPGRVSLKTAEFVGSDGEEVAVMVFRTPKESE